MRPFTTGEVTNLKSGTKLDFNFLPLSMYEPMFKSYSMEGGRMKVTLLSKNNKEIHLYEKEGNLLFEGESVYFTILE